METPMFPVLSKAYEIFPSLPRSMFYFPSSGKITSLLAHKGPLSTLLRLHLYLLPASGFHLIELVQHHA